MFQTLPLFFILLTNLYIQLVPLLLRQETFIGSIKIRMRIQLIVPKNTPIGITKRTLHSCFSFYVFTIVALEAFVADAVHTIITS